MRRFCCVLIFCLKVQSCTLASVPTECFVCSDNVKKPRRKEKRSSSNTSWYAECGLFDQTAEVQNTVIIGMLAVLMFWC